MYDVFKIVNWLRVKNNAELRQSDYAEVLTQMKAMKLLYYIQGVSLAYLNKKMFPNDIVAWKYGPAVAEVHTKYSGRREILGEITNSDIKDYNELSKDAEASEVLNAVWEAYGDMSASQLMRKTHTESPWKDTEQSKIITEDKMKEYFSKIVSEE